MFKNTFAVACALTISVLATGLMAEEETQVIKVYNWNDYIDPVVIDNFSKETGIKVDYYTYETAEELISILETGGADVIAPGLDLVRGLIEKNSIQAYSAKSIEGSADIQSIIRARLFTQDPSREYVAPYLWGRIGILLNRKAAESALGKPIEASWDILFNPETVSKLSQCGVSYLDARDYVYSIGMNYKGESLTSPTNRGISKLSDLLMEIRPFLKVVSSVAPLELSPKGELCAAMVWEGDAVSIQKNHPDLEFILPNEGTVIFVDTLAISSKSKNPAGARKWIEYLMRKDISEMNARYTSYNSSDTHVLDILAAEQESNGKVSSSISDGVPVFMSVAPKKTQEEALVRMWEKFLQMDKMAATSEGKGSGS